MRLPVLRLPGVLRAQWPAVAAVVAAVAYLAALRDVGAAQPVTGTDLVVSVAVCLTLTVRRRWPEAIVVVALGVTAWAIETDAAARDVAQLMLLAGLYRTAVSRRPAVCVAWGAVVGALGLAATFQYGTPAAPGTLVITTLALAAIAATPILLGRQVRSARRLAEDARALAAETERRHVAEAAHEQAAERARIARDVHDIVAHHVGSIVVQAGAARFAAATHPQELLPALDRIREAGDLTLVSLRQLLGVLREPDDATPSPGPSVAGIAELVDRARQSGTPVTLQLRGDLGGVDAARAACVYRLVQEGLTNAAKHAGPATPVRVEVGADGGELRVNVHNEAPADPEWTNPAVSARHGLHGMRTRVGLLGGTVTTGPDRGGWTVSAVLPPASLAAA